MYIKQSTAHFPGKSKSNTTQIMRKDLSTQFPHITTIITIFRGVLMAGHSGRAV
jgi:hypothetical protein